MIFLPALDSLPVSFGWGPGRADHGYRGRRVEEQDYTQLLPIIMSVKVAVRVRPFNQREKFLGCLNCIQMKDKTTILINPRDRNQKEHQFTFDYSLWSHDGFQELENGYLYPIDDRFVDQKRIFKQLGEDILKNAWNGFNCCLFAYGQTGAGKSYSMIGYESNRGIVPMACQKIFEGIQRTRVKGKKEFQLTISMLEIYNEKVQDLFIHTSKRPANGLRIRESKKVGIYVEGITRYEVHSYAQIERRMQEGAKNRSLASTLMNQYSSRAHTIVMIEFIQKEFITEQKMNKKTSMLNLVDLAGSERIAKTGISDKDRLKEASQINKSLHTLGRVIEHLAEMAAGRPNVQVPYRESALTRILETALGGNSVTTMICAISPANDNYEETLSTLRYADQTKKIKNKPIINESAVDKIIRELREENERLKQMLRIAKMKGINLEEQDGNIFANIQQIQREIRKNMQSFAINTEQSEQQSMMMTEFVDVPDPNDFYSGELNLDSFANTSTTTIGNVRANAFITNLSQDRLLSFKIKYSCEEELYVGNKNLKEGGKNRLVLCGLGVEDRHARLYEINGKYYIEPLCEQAYEYTLVNGKTVDRRTEIFHNDRIIFGTNSVFLFKNFNQKGVRSKGNGRETVASGVGSDNTLSRSRSNQRLQKPLQLKKFASQSISIGTDGDDLNESLLLDDYERPSPKRSNFGSSSIMTQAETSAFDGGFQQSGVDERLLDYEFAINQRQNKMLDTSASSFGGNMSQGINNQMVSKLEEIEKQFEQMKLENERKMRQKEEEFMAELKKLEIERQVEKAKLKQELKIKQQEAKKIAQEKERIEKIRDRLVQMEKQRKQKQRKVRESMLLGDDNEIPMDMITNFQEVPSPPNTNHTKKKIVSVGQVQVEADVKAEPIIETRIQYVDRHHFHYDFNVVHTEGGGSLPYQQYKGSGTSANTTSTNMTNLNPDESMLLESQQFRKGIQGPINHENKQQSKKNLGFQSVYNITEAPAEKPVPEKKQAVAWSNDKPEQPPAKNIRQQLNITDILYEPVPPRRKDSRKLSGKSEEEENLLNMTNAEALAHYIPKYYDQNNAEPAGDDNQNVSLDLSQDLTANYALREEELLEKIRQYEQKLKTLEASALEKKESIKNIRKSFAINFDENPNSDNFINDDNLFEGEIDFSVIQTKKDSVDMTQQTQFEKKIRRNMVQCQNENILNERTLQVRKRKREAEELKQAFIKKQKKQLQKQLVELIPMLEKFNLWAREMNRNLEGKVQIEYHNFTNYEIIDALKSSIKSKIKTHVKVYNYEEGRTYKWASEVFYNRYQIAQNLFQRYLQNPSNDLFSDKTKDPFWDPREFQPYAIGYLSLESLSYAVEFEGEIPLVYKGKIVGHLDVYLEPVIDRQSKKLRDKLAIDSQGDNQIYDPRQLLEQDVCFTISIEKFRPSEHLPTDKIDKYYISYELLEDNYKSEQYRTNQINISKSKIGYMLKHSLSNVTEHTLAYLADSPLCLTLNLLFEYDEEMSNVTSSFMQHSESSMNMSMTDNLLKSETNSSVVESPPPFAKKKATVIMENPDVLTKIEKEYSTEQKKIRQRAETIQSSSNRKKDKGKEDCTVF